MAKDGAWVMTRWAVLERDGFTCRYCGQFAPNVQLEVDHVLAVVEGGGDDMENLVTACFSCNRGKEAYRAHVNGRPRKAAAERGELVRVRVRRLVAEHGIVTTTEIARLTGWDPSFMSQVLRGPGFRRVKKVGRNVYYEVAP